MSTVKSNADHLTLNADGASKDIKFQANGVEKASISSTGVMTATSYAGDGSALTNLPGGGKVLQVVSATPLTTQGATSSTSYQTILSQAITPSSTSSRILILAHSSIYCSVSTGYFSHYSVLRDSTDLNSNGNGLATLKKDSAGNTVADNMTINYLDSPSTTSAITYTLKAKQNTGGGDTFWSYNGSETTLILMEIGA